MIKTLDNRDPESGFFFEVTPAQLRTWADRLEQRAKFAMEGQSIKLQFSPEASFIFLRPRGFQNLIGLVSDANEFVNEQRFQQ